MTENKHKRWRGKAWMAGVCAMAVMEAFAPAAWAAGNTGTVPAPAAAAPTSPQAAGGLVALGDSITFGYNLGRSNLIPSPLAYPYLVGKADNLPVTDLGVPGWTSADLRSALASPNFERAVRSARVVALDIGSNDLLGLAGKLGLLGQATSRTPVKVTAAEQAAFQAAITQMTGNLRAIVAEVKAQTNAPIVLYNLYDPFPAGTALHPLAENFTLAANHAIAGVGAAFGVPVLNAYSAFAGKQWTLVRVPQGDVHPTPAGQAVLAGLLEQAIPHLRLPQGAAAGSPAAVTTSLATSDVSPTGNTWMAPVGTSGQITVSAPSGALTTVGSVAVTSATLSAVSVQVPSGEKVVAEFGVDFPAFDPPTAPISFQYVNQAIAQGASVYEISPVNGRLSAMSGATVERGQVDVSVIGNADFVVVAPKTGAALPQPAPGSTVPGATQVSTGFAWLEDALAGALLVLGGLFALRRARRQP